MDENEAANIDLGNIIPVEAADVDQLDGGVTPDSLTPDTVSPESGADGDHRPSVALHRGVNVTPPSSPDWDHSPDRFVGDGAFLWEEEPLRALSVLDILREEQLVARGNDESVIAEVHDQEVISPLGVFRRQRVLRRKRVPQPANVDQVQLAVAGDFGSILTPHRPIVPETVNLHDAQVLDLVLDPAGGERLIN